MMVCIHVAVKTPQRQSRIILWTLIVNAVYRILQQSLTGSSIFLFASQKRSKIKIKLKIPENVNYSVMA